MRNKLLLILSLFLLVGCFAKPSQSETKDEMDIDLSKEAISFYSENERFSLIVPFVSSKMRLDHEKRAVYREDTYEITKQLQSMSAQYFKPNDYYIQEGVMLGSEEYRDLLRFNSEEYPMGLNPSKEQEFTTENGKKITQPIILVTMYEIDYYHSSDTSQGPAAMSFALAMNREVESDSFLGDRLSQQVLLDYGENAARKLVSYIRTIPELSQVPIFIGLYSLEKSDSTLPGGFVSAAYFESNSGQFNRINQEWVIFPSTDANQLAPDVATEFRILKQQIQEFIPSEQVGVIGKARLIDGKVNKLNITLSTTGKTYLEVQGLAQYAFQLISERFNHFSFEILVDVQVFGKTVMVIEKKGDVVKMVEW